MAVWYQKEQDANLPFWWTKYAHPVHTSHTLLCTPRMPCCAHLAYLLCTPDAVCYAHRYNPANAHKRRAAFWGEQVTEWDTPGRVANFSRTGSPLLCVGVCVCCATSGD
eukprot:3679285-Rhodomonas_salina.3